MMLNKIEQWAERLPYRTLRIEVELPGQTLTLEKSKARPLDLIPPPSDLQAKEVMHGGGA